MNAPTASVRPISSASTAEPITERNATIVKISRDCTRATRSSSAGSAKRAMPANSASAAIERSPTSAIWSPLAPPPPAVNIRTASRNGTTHRSWNRRIPTASCPCGASISPRCDSTRITSAVLDIATSAPSTPTERPGTPNAAAIAATVRSVITTCRPPPRRGGPPHLPQAIERQLEADLEQEEYHSELGHCAHALGIADPAQSPRPDQRPHHHVTRNRGQAQPFERESARGGHRDDQQQLFEEREVQGSELALACRCWSIAARRVQNRLRRGRPSWSRIGFSIASITSCSEVSLNTAWPSSCASTVSAWAGSRPFAVSTSGRLDGSKKIVSPSSRPGTR